MRTRTVIASGPSDTQLDKLQGQRASAPASTPLSGTSDAGAGQKPDPSIFNHALPERLGVAPAEALHVGDNLSTDVAGARPGGMSVRQSLNRAGTRARGARAGAAPRIASAAGASWRSWAKT